MGTKFFENALFKSKKVTQTIFRLKNNFKLHWGSVLLKQLYNLDLKFKENWPKKGRTVYEKIVKHRNSDVTIRFAL